MASNALFWVFIGRVMGDVMIGALTRLGGAAACLLLLTAAAKVPSAYDGHADG